MSAEPLQLSFDTAPQAPPRPSGLVGLPAPAAAAPFTVEVVRSARRKRTVGAQLRGGVLTVTVPAWMNAGETAAWVDKMAASYRRALTAERIDLAERAATLARRHELSRPREIRWADDMTARWGSCTPATGTIRISTRTAGFPSWVVDAVIVHELCHLEEPGHGPAFWRLAHRYPKMERAIGYLIAKSGDADDPEEGHDREGLD